MFRWPQQKIRISLVLTFILVINNFSFYFLNNQTFFNIVYKFNGNFNDGDLNTM